MRNLTKENLSKLPRTCGIYKITINNKFYIGSSNNIKNRLRHHLWSLNTKQHHNKTIQNYFNKYGINEVYFEIVEECTEDILIEREKYYIESLKPYMNHILDPQKIVRDDVYKKRLSEGALKSYSEGREVVNKRETHQYSLEGSYIKSFNSASDAMLELKGYKDPTAICAACNNIVYSAYGYRWSYNKIKKLPEVSKNYKEIAIIQMDKNNNFIKVWKSKTEAQKILKISNISRALKSPEKLAGGYKWKYESQGPH